MPRQKVLSQSELLNEATDLFWKNGYHKTSIQELVKTIGINRANLYDNFKDKGELFNECLQVYQSRMSQKIDDIFNDSVSSKNGFEKLFTELVKIIRSEEKKGCMISNTYSELLPSPNKKTNKILNDSQAFWLSTLQKKLQQAVEDKEIKDWKNLAIRILFEVTKNSNVAPISYFFRKICGIKNKFRFNR